MSSLRNRIRYKVSRSLDLGNLPFSWLPFKAEAALADWYVKNNSTYLNTPVVFVLSPGRSGTAYLASLFEGSTDVAAFHEPRPRMTSSARSRQGGSLAKTASTIWRIRQSSKPVYLESSHMFGRWFADEIIANFPNLKVVQLVREPAAIIRSCVELGYFSERNPWWKLWMHPVETADFWPYATDDDNAAFRCARYLKAIENDHGRVLALLRQSERPILRFDPADSSDSNLSKLYEFVGATGDAARNASTINDRQKRKAQLNIQISESRCREIWNHVSHALSDQQAAPPC